MTIRKTVNKHHTYDEQGVPHEGTPDTVSRI